MAQTYNSFEADKKRFRLWLAGIFFILLVLAAVVFFGRSAYRHFKEQRDQTQAQAFLAKGDFRSAMLSARQALLLNPTNVPACRVMATLADLGHSPAVLDWQRRIVQDEPTIENKLQLASAALRYQNPPFPLATQILDELATTATNLAGYHIVAASLALSLHRLAEAETHFEIASQLEPTNQFHILNLAVVRLGGTNVAQAAQARAVLEKFRLDPELGLPALRALVVDRLAHQDTTAANDYSTQLLASSRATLADQLQQLGILQQLKSAEFTARLQAVEQQVATNASAVAEVATWMQANHLLAENIQWLTTLPAGVQAQQPFRLALANAYLENANWPALRDFASQGNWEEMEFLRLALVARAWSQLGVPQVADSNWSSAVTETGNRYGALTMLLGLTERWQWKRERMDLLQRIVEKFPRERWAQQTLERLYLADGDTADLQKLYVRLLELHPQEIGYKNNLAATSLLLKTNLPQSYQLTAEIYAQAPGNPDVASTYAYALHLQGRDQEGVAALQKLPPAQLAEPSVAVYYAVLLAATGNADAAARYRQIARAESKLLPEEKQLLEAAAKPTP
jgi:predicted Zn-dependent protease